MAAQLWWNWPERPGTPQGALHRLAAWQEAVGSGLSPLWPPAGEALWC